MRQCDIREMQDGELVILLQHDLLDHFQTRVIVPLVPAEAADSAGRLHPTIVHRRRRYMAAMEQITVVRSRHMKRTVGSSAEYDCELRRALDVLLMGV